MRRCLWLVGACGIFFAPTPCVALSFNPETITGDEAAALLAKLEFVEARCGGKVSPPTPGLLLTIVLKHNAMSAKEAAYSALEKDTSALETKMKSGK